MHGSLKMEATFPAQLDHLSSMLKWIRHALLELDVTQEQLNDIELACEEALINIIQYSYPETAGTVKLSCTRTENGLVMTLIDQGLRHNPLHSVKAPPHSPHLGGYGIFIMLHLMDHVSYRYKNGCNELTLTKKLF